MPVANPVGVLDPSQPRAKLLSFSMAWGDPVAPVIDRRFRLDATPPSAQAGAAVEVHGGNLMAGSHPVPRSSPVDVNVRAGEAQRAWEDLSRALDRAAVSYQPQNNASFPAPDLRGKVQLNLHYDRPGTTHALHHTLLYDQRTAPLGVLNAFDLARQVAARAIATA